MDGRMLMRELTDAEQQAIIDDINARIPTLAKVGDISRWERGWSENLEAYKQSGDVADLRPKYIRPNQPVRWMGRFGQPIDPDAEFKWYEVFRARVVERWLTAKTISCVWEFGSGSGHNLAYLKPLLPVVGLDWSWAAVKIAETIAEGRRFDFLNPVLPDMQGKAVLTVGALEQTGARSWTPFMEELLLAKPEICVHIEPIVEWYDENNPVDATAIAVHHAKGFWVGFWDWLRARRREGKVHIHEAKRTGFGSIMVEGYSLIVWSPT